MDKRKCIKFGVVALMAGLAAACMAIPGCSRASKSDTTAMHYVVPAPGDDMEHAAFRALTVSENKPGDLKESVQYRGKTRRYAEFRFGSPTSTLVTVVLDDVSAGQTDIYVDADRNRVIEETDRLTGQGPVFRVPLNVEVAEGSNAGRFPRTVVFRLGRSGQSISYATAGYMEGVLQLDGQETPVRLVDNNGDGVMTDPADLIWIDANHDGKWDPISERLPFLPIVTLGNERYAMRCDLAGEHLSLKKLEGTGTLELVLPEFKDPGLLSAINVWLAGREGSIAKLDLAQVKSVVPVGEYYIYEISADMKDPSGGDPWTFYFSGISGKNNPRWHAVTADKTTTIHPLADLVLTATISNSNALSRPGEEIPVEPRLETGERMALRSCIRNNDKPDLQRRHDGAVISLISPDGKVLDTHMSGFS
ncbi:MAG: hypothetical protein ABSG67_06060 [Thermoguttaceae bacterium]|jgi:hypothetical protein